MTARRVWLAIFLAAVLATSAVAAQKPAMIDSLVATVGNETVSIEDVGLELEVLKHTKTWFAYEAAPENPTEKNAFRELIVGKLLYNQARKMGFGDVPPAEVEQAMEEFRATFATPAEYRAWLDEFELRDPGVKQTGKDLDRYQPLAKRFYRRIVIDKYLEKKIDVQVKLGLTSYVEEHRTDLLKEAPGATDEQLREMARNRLRCDRLCDHIDELEKRGNVVVLRERFL